MSQINFIMARPIDDEKVVVMTSDIPHAKAKVSKLPECDFCGDVARYDGRTKHVYWANMCDDCFRIHGTGLGLGRGQELILEESVSEEK